MLKIISSSIGRYPARTKTAQLNPKKTKEILRCVSQSCDNRVICRCTICSEYLCYEDTQHHRHPMINFEVLRLHISTHSDVCY